MLRVNQLAWRARWTPYADTLLKLCERCLIFQIALLWVITSTISHWFSWFISYKRQWDTMWTNGPGYLANFTQLLTSTISHWFSWYISYNRQLDTMWTNGPDYLANFTQLLDTNCYQLQIYWNCWRWKESVVLHVLINNINYTKQYSLKR